tara:strand:- start:122 stop:595 length:474 start_codon:yes stop_codon:yes gene_type:complete
MANDRDRGKKIIHKLNLDQLPFKINSANLNDFGQDTSKDLQNIFFGIESTSLKWCMSTVKKAKVFTIIYQANENGEPIYKEEIAKKLPEYSYKTIATIVDEGVEKGYYVSLDPYTNKIMKDKKIKNIRPSEEIIIEFLNWNIQRISIVSEMIIKYKK